MTYGDDEDWGDKLEAAATKPSRFGVIPSAATIAPHVPRSRPKLDDIEFEILNAFSFMGRSRQFTTIVSMTGASLIPFALTHQQMTTWLDEAGVLDLEVRALYVRAFTELDKFWLERSKHGNR